MSLSTRHLRLGVAGSTIAVSAFGAFGQAEFVIESHEGAVATGFVEALVPEADRFAAATAWSLTTSSAQATSPSAAAALGDFAGVTRELARRHLFFNTTAADFAASALRSCLDVYSRLSDGWDGPESKAPTARSIEAIEALVDRLPSSLPIPTAMLSRTGEVGLYWDVPNAFADLVVDDDRVFSVFVREKGSGVEEFAEDLVADEVSTEKLDELFASIAFRKG